MFKIGEFSKMAKTSIKTLRFYDEIDLFKPSFIEDNGYRYYSINDLSTISRIIELRDIGLPIVDIKKVLNGDDLRTILIQRSKDIKCELQQYKDNLFVIEKIINQIEKGEYMTRKQVKEIQLPEVTVYYRHGVIASMSNITDFILSAGEECKKNNPDLKCTGYCFVTYEAPEYQEHNVELEYLEAVEKIGKSSKNIKFKVIPSTKAVSVTHKGSYSNLAEAYALAINYVKEKGYQIADKIREVYIHGCWDCESEDDYVTEIQIPIK